MSSLAAYLDRTAIQNHAGKVIIYAFQSDWAELLGMGFRLEGVLGAYYRGEPAFCMSRFLDPGRAVSTCFVDEDHILRDIYKKAPKRSGLNTPSPNHESRYNLRLLREEDAGSVAKIFTRVFKTYPSPVEDIDYIKSLVSDNDYIMMVAEKGDEIAGIISAEIDANHLAAEITDCLTLPEHRGQGIMGLLIDNIEKELAGRDLGTFYSLARAGIPAINAVFRNRGYLYRGRLVNNCNIGGRFENMNMWEKPVSFEGEKNRSS
jgi:putative beta-lysine N-acetyltransferase